jgi:tetratricopeptide (TPR) repeat protein
LELITNTESLSNREYILNYLSKLDNNQLPLIFQYVQPMIKSALEETNNEDILHDILTLFIGEPVPTLPMDTSGIKTIKLDPVEVYEFLKKINEDFAIKYMENICLKPELGPKQRDIHNRVVYAYCDRIKKLSKELKPMMTAKQQQQKQVYTDDDFVATQSSATGSTPGDIENYSAIFSIKKQKTDYETKLKFFLLNQNCQCDFDKLEAYFPREQSDSSDEHLFSLPYAIVLGKLGRHEAALEIFVKNGFYTDAERYCETIYSNGNIQLARELYRKLIEHYLKKSNDGSLNENSLKTILRIVNNASERLDPVQTLEILPGQLKLNSVKDFIEHSLQTCSMNKRSSQLERNLLFLKLLRTQSKRIGSENHSFTIDADASCARSECTQPFTATQAVVRFPNDKIVHLHCRGKYETECEKGNKKRY